MFYKRFSQAGTPDEVQDLRSELVDRFGEAPDEVDNLCEQARGVALLRQRGEHHPLATVCCREMDRLRIRHLEIDYLVDSRGEHWSSE